jgi:hypothetical protein
MYNGRKFHIQKLLQTFFPSRIINFEDPYKEMAEILSAAQSEISFG